MTAGDDGGFRPHPGDPWHPDWSPDAEDRGVVEPEAADLEESAPGKPRKERKQKPRRAAKEPMQPKAKKPKKPKKQKRRKGAEEDVPADAAFDPSTTAFDVSDVLGEDAEPDDAFDAVLEREGRPRRRKSAPDAPPPAWTVDQTPPDDQVLPVEQPSWVGQSTEADSGLQGFEAESSDLDSPLVEAGAQPAVEAPELEQPRPEAPTVEEEPAAVGPYGVAGPEAYDVLGVDPGAAEGLGDWESFMEGEPVRSTEGQPEDWPDTEAGKRRRGLFRRRKDEPEVIDDGFVGSAMESRAEGSSEEAAVEETPFGRAAEAPAGEDAFDDWLASEPEPQGGFIRSAETEPADDSIFLPPPQPQAAHPQAALSEPHEAAAGGPDGDDGGDDLEAALAEALGALGQDLDGGDQTQPALAAPDIPAPPEAEVEQQPELFAPAPPASTPASADDADAARQPVDPGQVESSDWEGDPVRVPASWFAEIDEDVVVPPPAPETSETEWPEREPFVAEDRTGDAYGPEPPPVAVQAEGETPRPPQPGEGAPAPMPQEVEAWDSAVFDVEARPQPEEAVQERPLIPAGYEQWGQAVEEALDATADAATYEYDQPVLQERPPAADVLPAGFERFPGDMEQFELSQEELDAEMGTGTYEPGWVTRALDPGDNQRDSEFDEHIYAGQGTMEHRDLAALIAQSGDDEDTQWQAISAAMPGLETGVVGFEDVADLGSGDDYVAPVRSNLGVRVVTGLILVGLLFGTLLLSEAAFVGFIGVMVMLGLVEFYAALRRSGYLPLTLFGLIGGAATFAATWFHGPLALPSGMLLTSMMTFFFYAFSPTRRDALANGGLTILGIGWIVGTLGFVIPIARSEERVMLIVAIVVVTAAMDIGAFSFGRTWGRSPLSPVLSPNKTAEGLLGGIALAVAAAAAIGFFELGPLDLRSALMLGAVVVILAPLGDLAESMVKRSLGIKDMGTTLPGHGGVLDRVDAFLFVVPAAWVLFETLGLLA